MNYDKQLLDEALYSRDKLIAVIRRCMAGEVEFEQATEDIRSAHASLVDVMQRMDAATWARYKELSVRMIYKEVVEDWRRMWS